MALNKVAIVLMDNGSLRPESTMQLRVLSDALAVNLKQRVYPVSLLHSSKIDPQLIGNIPAVTLIPFMRSQRRKGINKFIVVPLFFGPSGALVDYLPKRVSELQSADWPELDVKIAETLVQTNDARIAEIIAALIREKLKKPSWEHASVAMCDHGTPLKSVNVIRSIVEKQLKILLADSGVKITACSMERRDGDVYAFNEPLLEDLLGTKGFRNKVIVSLLFAGPGRHAGEDGDIAKICHDAKRSNTNLEIEMTDLVGSKVNSLIAILSDRFNQLIHKN